MVKKLLVIMQEFRKFPSIWSGKVIREMLTRQNLLGLFLLIWKERQMLKYRFLMQMLRM